MWTYSLADLGMLDAPSEPALDRLTHLATSLLGVPISLLSIVLPEQDRQFFKSATGLAEPWASRRGTPLSHSFCQHVRRKGAPLVVEDARADPRLRDSPAVPEIGVVAYLGAPVHDQNRVPVGALCAIDGSPRSWSERDVEILNVLAGAASDQIRLRASLRASEEVRRELEATSRARLLFLAMTSHEIRTPLNGVVSMAEILETSLRDPCKRGMAQVIRQSGEATLAILNDVLDLSKIDSGKLELERAPFDPVELLRRVERLHELKAHEKGIVLEALVDAGGGTMRIGDPHRVLQILHNLVGNAVKFTEEGGVAVTLGGGAGGTFVIRVRDSGIGMTEEEAAFVFDAFRQADTATTRRFGGTGLGMGIARMLVDAMNGTISLSSRPGEGTEVVVTLPLELAAGEDLAERTPEPEPRPTDDAIRGLRVLVVDDNGTNRLVASMLLQQLGIEAVLLEDGRTALATIEETRFDLLMLDISMPTMCGVELLARIREAEAGLGRPRSPAIAVTANAYRHQVEEYLAAGFDAHLVKPLRLDKLVGALERHAPKCGATAA